MLYSKKKNAQAAVEFLMVVGIAFTMLVPALYMFTQYSKTSNQIVVASQIERLGKEIISNAESIYYYGKNSRTTVKVSFPERITDIYLNPKIDDVCVINSDMCLSELVFVVDLFGGESHFVFYTPVNITLNVTDVYTMQESVVPGLKNFVIESYGSYVNISRKIK